MRNVKRQPQALRPWVLSPSGSQVSWRSCENLGFSKSMDWLDQCFGKWCGFSKASFHHFFGWGDFHVSVFIYLYPSLSICIKSVSICINAYITILPMLLFAFSGRISRWAAGSVPPLPGRGVIDLEVLCSLMSAPWETWWRLQRVTGWLVGTLNSF